MTALGIGRALHGAVVTFWCVAMLVVALVLPR